MPTNVPNPFADGIRSLGASLFDPTAKAKAAQINSQLSTDELQRQKLRLDIGQSTQQQGATNHLADMFGSGNLLEQKPDGTFGISTGMRNEYVKNYLLSRPNAPHSEILNALNTYEDSVVKQQNQKALQAAKPRTGAEVIGGVLEKTDPELIRLHALDIKPLQGADGSFIAPPAIQKLYRGGSAAAPQLDQTDAPPDFVPSAPSAKPTGQTSLIPELPTGGAQAPVIPGLSAKDTAMPRDAGSVLFGGEAPAAGVPTFGPKKPVAPDGRKLSPAAAKIQDGIVQATDTLGSLEIAIGRDGSPGLIGQNPDAFGMKNYLPNDFTQRSKMKGFADGVQARVTVMRIANNAIHALYGGNLTVNEMGRAKSSEVFETDSPETVTKKLEVLRELTERHLSTLKLMGSRESGYITNPKIGDLIDKHLGNAPAQPQQSQPAAPDFGTHFNGKRILKVEQVK